MSEEELRNNITSFASQKLFHEFTNCFVALIRRPERARTAFVLEAFNQYVVPVIDKLNPVRVANILQWCIEGMTDLSSSVAFLDAHEKTLSKDDEAHLFWSCLRARCLACTNKTTEALELLQAISAKIETLCAVDPAVRGAYHYTQAILYRQLGNWELVHNELALFLAYTSLNSLIPGEVLDIAEFATVAALCAPRVVSLSELAGHACIHALANDPERGWQAELLEICADGRLKDFHNFMAKNKPKVAAHATLGKSMPSLFDKIKLLALVDLAFQQPIKQRTLTFKQIADHCQIEVGQVELMVIRAVARQVVTAKIDQINKIVNISWVKPRMLDNERLNLVKDRIHEWSQHAATLSETLENMAPEILAAQPMLN